MDGTFIKETELAKKIREADIVLGIFGDSTKAKSVIPNKAYQALASKKALITMRAETLYEFLTDDDMLTCDNTPIALAEAMKKLILNPQFIATYQQNGYNRFLSLYDKTQHNFIQFIQSIDTKKE
jgi:spore maturation protein CgeB